MINLRHQQNDDRLSRGRRPFDPNYTATQALEGLFYEVKPIVYFIFSVTVLRTAFATEQWVKLASVGILLFSLYIIYRRMVYRGLIG